MDITAIKRVSDEDAKRYVPPLTDYNRASTGWEEAEFRQIEASNAKIVVGYWTGAPGDVTIDPWPYTEVCSILTGKVAIADSHGGKLEFKAGEAFIIPRGFAGQWVTLEPSTKLFVAIL